jgi:hypothetical protein
MYLVHELLPNVAVVALLVKSDNPNAESAVRDAREAARLLGMELHPLKARTAQEIDTARSAPRGFHSGKYHRTEFFVPGARREENRPSMCLPVKPVGESDAGNPRDPVR